ncbi:hypothetical protein ACFV1W_22325 [Kitasatospora sp. NPDC059648]|uniref:hypothetical protein n=1 Tax=Kitasatospora sp. NPDC059648 TaxID=3346894 RepID=UPI0036A4000C
MATFIVAEAPDCTEDGVKETVTPAGGAETAGLPLPDPFVPFASVLLRPPLPGGADTARGGADAAPGVEVLPAPA